MTINQDGESPAFHREIVELHQFFEDWFTGRLPKTDNAYARFTQVIAEGFTIIGPDGKSNNRAVLLDNLFAAHEQQPNTSIWIKNAQLRQQWADNLVVTYEEWQASGDSQTARLSTVVFRQQEGTPNGLEWLHVHETWLPGHGVG